MQSTMTRMKALRPVMGRLVLALVMAGAVAGTLALPARADDHDRYDGDRHDRERVERERHAREEWREQHAREEWREQHRRPVYVAPPAYVYAPPPVVYAPPPPPAGINLFFPLNIR
ncbi:MAG TPA: hypothetical protein VF113_04015 [Stellaceae bacterium]